jgi:YHS domain-containing protein
VDNAIKSRCLYARVSLAPVLGFAMLFWTGTPASGQTASTQDQQTMPPQTPPQTSPQTMPPETMPPETMPPQHEGDNDTTRRELASMDRFLDSHPEIAEQLRKDPSLINNEDFVETHPELREFLQNHPGVREEFKENPNAFMRQENRYDRHEDDRDHDRRDGDTTRRELASMDRFMDGHPEIAEQLHKNPSLVNNREFVENHPALQEYLQSHQEVREEFKENPNAFMRQENRYDRHEDDRNRDYGSRADARGDRNRMGDPEGRGELTSFGQFLGGHSSVAEQLSKDPSLANNKEYLANHPELGEYLKAHPAMTRQLSENPQAVMSSNWVMQGSGTAGKPSTQPKPKVNPNQ